MNIFVAIALCGRFKSKRNESSLHNFRPQTNIKFYFFGVFVVVIVAVLLFFIKKKKLLFGKLTSNWNEKKFEIFSIAEKRKLKKIYNISEERLDYLRFLYLYFELLLLYILHYIFLISHSLNHTKSLFNERKKNTQKLNWSLYFSLVSLLP